MSHIHTYKNTTLIMQLKSITATFVIMSQMKTFDKIVFYYIISHHLSVLKPLLIVCLEL